MNIACFTDLNNVKLLECVFKKYCNDIMIYYIFEMCPKKCEYKNIYYYQHDKDKTYDFLLSRKIDYAVVYGWNHKIPEYILNKITFFNIHPSVLPKYRGPIPLIFQLLKNEKVGGVTIHKMDGDFDSGPIYQQINFPLNSGENMQSLFIKTTRGIMQLLDNLLNDIINSNVCLHNQDNNQASYFSFNDLDQYIINHKMSYDEFFKVYKTLYGRFPVKVDYKDECVEIILASESSDKNTIKYSLCDQDVYFKIKPK